MNIAKILKDFPKGTKLYSSLFGELELIDVKNSRPYPITCSEIQQDGAVRIREFTKDGKMLASDAEHTLFPSKTQRDWSKFGMTDKVNDHQFKPFEKVLVRDEEDDEWVCDIFSHIDELHELYYCVGTIWKQCIPYEENEHLLGTTNKPE